jgi:asparagine synthase (glutamine-hydrolysing)
MCGIAGIVDLSGGRAVPAGILRRMADALVHRGPDDEGYLHEAGVGLASRRLSIVGLSDGHQPIANEDGTVVAAFNGELFEYRDLKRALESKGHRFVTHCDTELIPHLWEDHQERMFERIRGQFAIAVYDRRRGRLVLARDRFGICPLYWTRQTSAGGDWLLFASEVKALLASGMVTPRPDLKGIDQVFHFFAVPGPSTCFEGVTFLQPGRYLSIELPGGGRSGRIEQRAFWAMDFPDEGQAEEGDKQELVRRFEHLMLGAVERRLRADVPVVCYLSGGIDSSLIVAMAARIRGTATPAFTVQIKAPHLDETRPAAIVARHVGARPVVVPVADDDVVATYPDLIRAAEAPVIDTASAASLLLAREVHRHGFKVALAGEGSDEWLAGYPWHKVHRLIRFLDRIPGLPMGAARRLGSRRMGVPPAAAHHIREIFRSLGHRSAFHDVYSLMTTSRFLFFNDGTLEALRGHNPYLELEPDLARIQRWDSYNQSAYWGARIQLNGHLLSLKGDRVAMHSSVEGRYPFLDEDVFAFVARLHPRWKMPWLRDKYILRLVGERYLPREIAWRPKAMFVAPFDSFLTSSNGTSPGFVDQLLSEESLRKTGWFDAGRVHVWRDRVRARQVSRLQRTIVHMGMVGVITSQLWYHTFIDSTLADLPGDARLTSPSVTPECSTGRAGARGGVINWSN